MTTKEMSKVVVINGITVDLAIKLPTDHDLTNAEIISALDNKVGTFIAYRLTAAPKDMRYWRNASSEKVTTCNWLSGLNIKHTTLQGYDLATALMGFLNKGLTASIAELAGIEMPVEDNVMPTTLTTGGVEYPIQENNGKFFICVVHTCSANSRHLVTGIRKLSVKDNNITSIQTFTPDDKDASVVSKGKRGYICGNCNRDIKEAMKPIPKAPRKGKAKEKIMDLLATTNRDKFLKYEDRITQLEAYASQMESDKDKLLHEVEGLKAELGQRIWTISRLDEHVAELKAAKADKDMSDELVVSMMVKVDEMTKDKDVSDATIGAVYRFSNNIITAWNNRNK